MIKTFLRFTTFSFLITNLAFAAQPIDTSQKSIKFLSPFIERQGFKTNGNNIKESQRSTDFNNTTHIRIKQNFAGYPVWGGDVIVHIPKNNSAEIKKLIASDNQSASMNGILYQDLTRDLSQKPAFIFSPEQSKKAINHAIHFYEQKNGVKVEAQREKSQIVIYIDDHNKAHWANHISLFIKGKKKIAAPNFILDAITMDVYKTWDEVKRMSEVEAGGFGGNKRIGRLTYDGLKGNLSRLTIHRSNSRHICFLANDHVIVIDGRTNDIAQFFCSNLNKEHNNIYWDGSYDGINGSYSPNNDTLFAGTTLIEMFRTWYQIPVLKKNNGSAPLELVTHDPMEPDNAGWFEGKAYFGDGEFLFYPLTSLGVIAHELAHGFTEQNSNLLEDGQAGGLNESFSDMTAQAIEFYVFGKSSWKLGAEISKEDNWALRYMDNPSKDCEDQSVKDDCSFDNLKDYEDYIERHQSDDHWYRIPNPHYSSGIYNKFFYLLANSPGWDTKKAFGVMIQANRFYWTSTTTFSQAACGVLSAAKDYKYKTSEIVQAFKNVGIETKTCKFA